MLLELINLNDYVTVNKKAIQIFGANTAIYLSILLYVYGKAIKKNKLVDGKYVQLDRKYMREQSSLYKDEQLICDEVLISAGIINKPILLDDSVIGINMESLTCALTELTVSEIRELKTTIKEHVAEYKSNKSKTVVKVNKASRNSEIIFDKNTQSELYNAVSNWIETIGKQFGYKIMSSELLNDFQTELLNFGNNNTDVMLEVISIATTFVYKDVRFAIKSYKDRHKSSNKSFDNIASEQERATEEDYCKGEKF